MNLELNVIDDNTAYFIVRGKAWLLYYVYGEFIYESKHGYSYQGFKRILFNNPPHSSFKDFVKEISDNGMATFTRPFTDEERVILTLKFGHPTLPINVVNKFYHDT